MRGREREEVCRIALFVPEHSVLIGLLAVPCLLSQRTKSGRRAALIDTSPYRIYSAPAASCRQRHSLNLMLSCCVDLHHIHTSIFFFLWKSMIFGNPFSNPKGCYVLSVLDSPFSSSSIPNICHNAATLPNGRSAPSSVAAASYRDRGSCTRVHNAAYACPRRPCAARCTRACRAGAVSAASRGACTASREASQCANEESALRSAGGAHAGTCARGS
jgi:hypothetical protein